MKNLTLLIKPASGHCNMRCKYCFYEDVSDHREEKSMGMMSLETAGILIQKAVSAVSDGGTVSFMFQGGEPTLAGLDFFRSFVEMEKEFARPTLRFEHSIQTNGLLLDRQWAAFLKEEDFLVGLSLDGNPVLHDQFRPDAAGLGTWQRGVNALQLLDEFGVPCQILCVVTGKTAKNPHRIYRSLTALGRHPMQFIPCLDPLEEDRGTRDFSLSPEQYGKFLCGLFDCWYGDWKKGNYVTIRNFEDYLRHLLRMPPASCSASGSCGHYLVAEGNGNLYPCDFYVLDRYFLGNIHQVTPEEALNGSTAQAFRQGGAIRPEKCTACPYRPLCRGGCKRDFDATGNNYYCPAYRCLFDYGILRLEEMAAAYARFLQR